MLTTTLAAYILNQQSKILPTPTLFVDGLAIATYKNNTWAPVTTKLTPTVPFKVYRLDLVRIVEITQVYELQYSDGVEGNFVDSHTSNDVVWSGPKPKYPRSIQIANPEQSDYKALIRDFIKSETKKSPDYEVEINSIARCDLDGDGKEEVLIEAQSLGFNGNFDFEPTKTRQMSCTLLRHIKNGKPTTQPIFFFHRTSGADQEPIQITHLKSIADLNGDGNYEVIVSADYYEGQSAHVFNLIKGQFKQLVENGAGA
ncbi:MAG: hypothetical protein ACKVQS_12950 [Fimbriimonadaceae bacterium]